MARLPLRIGIHHVGRAASGSLTPAIDDFAARIDRLAHLTIVAHRNGRSPEEEGPRLLKSLGSRRFLVLDPGGRALGDDAFGELLSERLAASNQEILFVIGGAAGVGREVRARAEGRISLSALTLSHDLARLVLLEQIYRALSRLSGSPYAK